MIPERLGTLNQAKRLILDGGLVIYPTETFCALGCHPDNTDALACIYRLKRRQEAKPLPLLAASAQQAAAIVDLTAAPPELIETFWPGPLTLLLPAKKHLAQALINPQHKTAIRVSSHPGAAQLAEACGGYLPSTSANFAGLPAAASIDALDGQFVEACRDSGLPFGLYGSSPGAWHSTPSTLVEPLWSNERWLLRILRPGSIDTARLANKNWTII